MKKKSFDPRLGALSNKQVPFQFYGEKMTFHLSMGLFSSFDIDAGTRLLLKTLAKETELETVKKAVDTGCGTGVIGLSLKKKFPAMEILFQDRDALATAYTAGNCLFNGVSADRIENALLLEGLAKGSQDLIVSNIPAKAGEKVLNDFFSYAGSFLKEGGRVAVVIVDPLKELAEKALEDAGCRILYRESTKMHTVFHFDGGKDFPGEDFSRYIRHKGAFEAAESSYTLETVYNLPDFDQLSYTTRISAELMKHTSFSGEALFWNPGQGHSPIWLNERPSNHFTKIHLASRDILQNRISRRNLENSGFDKSIESYELPGVSWLKESLEENSLDLLHINLSPIPRVKWHQELMETAHSLVKPGKFCFLMGRSSDQSQLVKFVKGFSYREDDRFKGNRGILLQKD